MGTDICRVVGDSCELPRITQETHGYDIQVEEVVVGCCCTLVEAVLLWAVAYSVFAQPLGRTPRRAAIVFIQHFVLRVQDATVPRLCWTLAKRLKLD